MCTERLRFIASLQKMSQTTRNKPYDASGHAYHNKLHHLETKIKRNRVELTNCKMKSRHYHINSGKRYFAAGITPLGYAQQGK